MSEPTTTQPLDLAELRRLATDAATTEPWEYARSSCGDYWSIHPTGIEGKDNGEGPEEVYRYIAHADPTTILALLDRLEAAEAERDNLRRLLGLVYDLYRRGWDCYEPGLESIASGFVGTAINISEDTEEEIKAALKEDKE